MKKKFVSIFGSLLLLGAFLTPSSVSAASCTGVPYVDFYRDINYVNFMGRFCYPTNAPDLRLWTGWNDNISSYTTHNFTYRNVTLYIDTQYGGISVNSYGNSYVPNLGAYWRSRYGDGFNDKTSSFRIW